MQLVGRAAGEHLTYCTNVHAGEDLASVRRALAAHVPRVKAHVAPDSAFGMGLRLSAAAAEALADPAALRDVAAELAAMNAYVFTLNGFPYGAFHGETVKTRVYEPDWATEERLAYTDRLATILAALLPQGVTGSISTVPLGFGPASATRRAAMTDMLLRHVAHLVAIRRRCGADIALALEPEPACLIETIAGACAYFERELFTERAAGRLAAIAGLSGTQAAEAIRHHLGLCYDTCHAAVEFEDPAASIRALRSADIRIVKLQLSSALRIPALTPDSVAALRDFDETTYLHQVVARKDGQLHHYLDLPMALAEADAMAGAEWRVHFHVPIFLDTLDGFATTQPFLREILTLHRQTPLSTHLEVETYTWNVLPPEHRAIDLDAAIAREMGWVAAELTA